MLSESDIEALESYRKGVEDGTMKSASPNCVRHLLDIIDRLRPSPQSPEESRAEYLRACELGVSVTARTDAEVYRNMRLSEIGEEWRMDWVVLLKALDDCHHAEKGLNPIESRAEGQNDVDVNGYLRDLRDQFNISHAILDQVRDAMSKARSDIWQTARVSERNLTGKDLLLPNDEPVKPDPPVLVHRDGVDESLRVVKQLDEALKSLAGVRSSRRQDAACTPVYKHYSPVTSDGQQYTNVFHRDEPGKLIAKFFGPNHIEDARRYCDTFGEDGK